MHRGLSAGLTQQVSASGAKIIIANQPTPICKGVYSTGVLGEGTPEQTLVLNSKQGLILICGCAHPGILNIMQSAMTMFKKPVLFVFGGFHLGGASETTISGIIKQFIASGVKKVGGSHCTGAKAMQMFQQAYGENYIQMGVGKIIGLQ
jgi:7,8-dihydropterin-6-yl-methyl-4-(beta-D-ribofuranosyl)aminobenzene 5'-phosphate synthase